MIMYRNFNMKFDYQKFRNDIEVFVSTHELRYADVDVLAGIGGGNTSNVIAGNVNQKMNTWLSIANAMDIDVRTYFVLDTHND